MTQRGRGEHLFWILTQSPPPDFGLSDPRRDNGAKRCRAARDKSGTPDILAIDARRHQRGPPRAGGRAGARAPPGRDGGEQALYDARRGSNSQCGADRSKSQSRGYELVSPGDPTCTERLRGFIGYSARRACADRDGHGAWRGGAKLCGSAKMGDGVNRSSVRRVMSCLV